MPFVEQILPYKVMTLKPRSGLECSKGEDLSSHYEVTVRYPGETMHNGYDQ